LRPHSAASLHCAKVAVEPCRARSPRFFLQDGQPLAEIRGRARGVSTRLLGPGSGAPCARFSKDRGHFRWEPFMFNKIDLRELAQVSGPERAFVSLYLATPESFAGL